MFRSWQPLSLKVRSNKNRDFFVSLLLSVPDENDEEEDVESPDDAGAEGQSSNVLSAKRIFICDFVSAPANAAAPAQKHEAQLDKKSVRDPEGEAAAGPDEDRTLSPEPPSSSNPEEEMSSTRILYPTPALPPQSIESRLATSGLKSILPPPRPLKTPPPGSSSIAGQGGRFSPPPGVPSSQRKPIPLPVQIPHTEAQPEEQTEIQTPVASYPGRSPSPKRVRPPVPAAPVRPASPTRIPAPAPRRIVPTPPRAPPRPPSPILTQGTVQTCYYWHFLTLFQN